MKRKGVAAEKEVAIVTSFFFSCSLCVFGEVRERERSVEESGESEIEKEEERSSANLYVGLLWVQREKR